MDLISLVSVVSSLHLRLVHSWNKTRCVYGVEIKKSSVRGLAVVLERSGLAMRDIFARSRADSLEV